MSPRDRARAGDLRRRRRQHHPSGVGRVHDRDDRAGRCRKRRARRLHAPHARRSRRCDPRHRHEDDRCQDANRGLHRPIGQPRGVGRLHHHHRGRCGGDGAGNAHRRSAPGLGRRRRDGRDELEEGGRRYRRLRAHDCGQAWPERAAGRPGRTAEQGLYRRRSGQRDAAARRSHCGQPRRSHQEAGWPDGDPFRRTNRDLAHGLGKGRPGRDDSCGSASSARSRIRTSPTSC